MKKSILALALTLTAPVHALTVDQANKYSDDYGPTLRQATIQAVDRRLCTLPEIADWSWTRSTKYAATWFTYCGGETVAHRIYFTKSVGFWNDKCTDRKVTFKDVEIDGKPLTWVYGQSCRQIRK